MQPVNRTFNSSYQERLLTPFSHKPQNPTKRLRAPPLDIASIHRNASSVPLQVESPIDSTSPVVFRPLSGAWDDHDYDHGSGSANAWAMTTPSPSRRASAGHDQHPHIASSTDDMAFLDISEPGPSSDYNFLLSRLAGQDDLHLPRPLPPRSSSLRGLFEAVNHSTPMLRAPSPCPPHSMVDDDRCSESMVFAPKDPNEPEYGSASPAFPDPPTLFVPVLHRSMGSQKRRTPKTMVWPKTISPSPPEKSRISLPQTNVRVPSDAMLATHVPTTLATRGASRMPLCGAPTPVVVPRKPKPKPISFVETASDADKSSLFSTIKKVRMVVARKSISSLDAMVRPVRSSSLDQARIGSSSVSSSTTVESTSTFSIPSSSDEDELPDGPSCEIPSSESRRSVDLDHAFHAHVVVDGVWHKQEISQVIPVLRSMKFGGK